MAKNQENKKVENIVSVDNSFDDKTLGEVEKATDKYIREERKKLLLKYFDFNLYAAKKLSKHPFYLIVFWAIGRDCYIDVKNDNLVVLRRIKNYKIAPKLIGITEKGDNFIFKVKYYQGKIKDSKKSLWETKIITIPKSEIEHFKEEYKDEIKELEERYQSNKC